MLSALAATAVLGTPGCTIRTSVVQVRDTSRVAMVSTDDGHPIVAPGETEGTAAQGSFFVPFEWDHYTIRGERDSDGALTLQCDECMVRAAPLLLPDGTTTPTFSWRVAVDQARVMVSYQDGCMQPAGKFCHAKTPVRLDIPRDDVVEVRRRTEPIRPVGYMFTAASALALGALTYVAFRNHDDAPLAAVAAVPFLGLGVFGVWEIAAPAKDETLRP